MRQSFAISSLFLLLGFFFYTSCTPDIIDNPDDKIIEPVDSTYSMRFSLDGEHFGLVKTVVGAIGPHRPLDSLGDNESFLISGIDANDAQLDITLWGKPKLGTQTYSFPDSLYLVHLPPVFALNSSEQDSWSNFLLSSIFNPTTLTTTGSVTLTKITSTTIEGTFEGTVIKNETEVKGVITSGRFVAKRVE